MSRMYEINMSAFQRSVTAFRQTITEALKRSEDDFPFTEFLIENHPGTVAVIDGSNHNIQGKNFVLTLLRVGHLLFQRGVIVNEHVDPITMEFITNNDAYPMGYKHKYQEYFSKVADGVYTGRIEFEKITDRLRSIMEWQKVKKLIEQLNKNDIILFDGSLLSGEITLNQTFYEQIVHHAKAKGVILVGLSKDTSLSIGSAPAPLVLLRASKRTHAFKNWLVRFEDTWFVRFTQDEDIVFRLDIEAPEGISDEQVVKWIGSYALFDNMLGFPYPAQFIHDYVRIDKATKQQCFEQFQDMCLEQGMSQAEVDEMFAIYHETMDAHSLGR
ncbi:DNA double-strand break repair nuclease NurA [Bacillus luti]|nr:DNA double-strand break repair nuclease NurA [Bacillus cereus]